MANAYLYFKKPKVKKSQMLYLGYKFGVSQILYPLGIRLNPNQIDIKKKKVINVTLLEGDITKLNMPTVNDEFKFNYDNIQGILDYFIRKVNSFGKENFNHLTKESLRNFIDALYNKKDEELSNFINKLNYELNSILIERGKNKKEISKAELIEIAEKFLASEKSIKPFFEYVNTFIEELETGKRVNDGQLLNFRTIQRYKTTKDLLIEFEKKFNKQISFDSIDYIFETEFNSFMTINKNYTPATIGKHISTLKSILKAALKDEIHSNIKFQNFKVKESDSNSIALTTGEINELYQLDLSKDKRLENVRDMFVLGCQSGLRWSDFTDIKPENIKSVENGLIIDIIQEKTKKQVVIPVDKIVSEILLKYNNQLPKPISNQKFNEYIKEVAKMVDNLHKTETFVIIKGGKIKEVTKERWRLVSSHTARRSFATNSFEKNIETKLIRAITGHKTDISFYSYLKTDAKKQAEMFREKNK